MPNRLDEYSNKVDNLRLPNEIASYTASDANTFPSFNAAFKYSHIVSYQDGSYVYKILADDMDNIPTWISFNGKTNLLTVEYLNTSNLNAMNGMFSDCPNLTSIDASDWDTSKVTTMSGIFYNCSNLSSVTGIDSWYCPRVSDISSMFQGAYKISTVDAHTWKKGLDGESKITTVYSFANNGGTKYIDISGIVFVDDVNFANAFKWGLKTLKWSNWKNTIDLSQVTTLTQECVIDLVANLAEVTSTKTLTLGSTLLGYLTEEQIAAAVNKGWTLA
jgi:surface protein